jgi:hypothetical protein
VGDSATDTLPSDVSATSAGQAADPSNSMVDVCNALASNGGGGFNPIGTAGGVNSLSALLAGISIDPVKGCKVTPAGTTECVPIRFHCADKW